MLTKSPHSTTQAQAAQYTKVLGCRASLDTEIGRWSY
jgi:hypothetical protein